VLGAARSMRAGDAEGVPASRDATVSSLAASEALRSYTFDAAFKHVHTLIKLACLRPETSPPPPRSVLLSAPPGTGKTAFVQEAATLYGLSLVSVPHLLLSPASLASAFSSARQSAPALLLLDDIHCMFPRGSDDPQHQYRVISSLLSLLSSLSVSPSIGLLIVATSSPASIHRLHPAVRSAFEFTFSTTVPTAEHRLFTLQHLLRPVSPLCDLPFLSELNAQCQGMTGADLLALCRAAAQLAAQSGDTALTVAHFIAAVTETRPSMLPQTLQRVEQGGGGEGERVSWDAVLGLDDIKQRLLECVQPLLPTSAVSTSVSPLARALRPPAGVLLYGLPGTGKVRWPQLCSARIASLLLSPHQSSACRLCLLRPCRL
jgi:SpoVK/Ycf46/Vps4 family AAA+-type ATPase